MLKYKSKGAYSTPDPFDWAGSISTMQPPGWHRDWSNCVSARAAVAHMVHGCDIEQFIRMTTNPFDFMCGIKVGRGHKLLHNGVPQQRTTRYYITRDGAPLIKHLPATGKPGAYKKKPGVSDADYESVMRSNGGAHDPRVCTGNKSTYQQRETGVEAGYNVTICNDAADFHFDNINYAWYVQEAMKLVV